MSKRTKNEAVTENNGCVKGPCLMTVALACRHHPRLAALPDTVCIIDSFLDCDLSKWTLEKASYSGFVRLMDRLEREEWPSVSRYFRQKCFDHAVEAFFSDGGAACLDVLQWWVAKYLPDQFDASVLKIFRHAVDRGRLDVIQWLHAQGKFSGIDKSAQNNMNVYCKCPELAYWLHEHANSFGLKLDVDPTTVKDNFPYFQWVIRHKDTYHVKQLDCAVEELICLGMLDELKWLHEHGAASFSAKALAKAIEHNHVAVAEWLYSTFPKDSFSNPSQGGCSDFPTAKWVVEKFQWKPSWQRSFYGSGKDHETDESLFFESSTALAAHNNDLEAVKLLYKNRRTKGYKYARDPVYFQGDHAIYLAAQNGNLVIVQWLYEHGDTDSYNVMDAAAMNNHLEVIQWLHEKGCQGRTKRAMDIAAARNHMRMVQWLHEHPSEELEEECTTVAMDRAAAAGRLKMVQWFHQHRTEGCTTMAMDEAAACGLLEMVKWLHENRQEGCTTDAIDLAVKNGHLEVVQLLHENRTEGCTTDAMDEACANGHLAIVRFLHSNRQEGCTANAFDDAAKSGHLDILKWLCANVSQGCTESTLSSGALNGQLHVVQFLTLDQNLFLQPEAFKNVADKGYFAVLEWLLKHYQLLGKLVEGNSYVNL